MTVIWVLCDLGVPPLSFHVEGGAVLPQRVWGGCKGLRPRCIQCAVRVRTVLIWGQIAFGPKRSDAFRSLISVV